MLHTPWPMSSCQHQDVGVEFWCNERTVANEGFPSKNEKNWMGSYTIKKKNTKGSYKVQKKDRKILAKGYCGNQLNLYKKS